MAPIDSIVLINGRQLYATNRELLCKSLNGKVAWPGLESYHSESCSMQDCSCSVNRYSVINVYRHGIGPGKPVEGIILTGSRLLKRVISGIMRDVSWRVI